MENAAVQEVARISIRVPPFWPEEPALWFSQLENQFALAGITQDATKYSYISSSLEQQYAREVKDIINNPPAENRYLKLKTELIKRLSASQEKKYYSCCIMKSSETENSQFLRHLQTLAGMSVTDDFLRTLWSDRLPANVRAILASQKMGTLEDLAELADSVYELVPPSTHISAISNNFGISELKNQITELTREVASLKIQSCSQIQPQTRHRENKNNFRRRSRSRSQPRRFNTSFCWYHNRFGDRATRCTTPCGFVSSSVNANGSRK
ncbi:uncharacterized protein LOC131842827 [Achroia grisella]|uniref:uncharacterized protein LOC131842827 n=1 Tax=Achroia grisella TaxID=688607 RepID=UPI0027D2D824|nr:uncharacterized protein LOC131842827 [Achroia grisella]